jgi:hypothetical protein
MFSGIFKSNEDEEEGIEFSDRYPAQNYGALADEPAPAPESKEPVPSSSFFSKMVSSVGLGPKPSKRIEFCDQSRLTPQQKKVAREAADIVRKSRQMPWKHDPVTHECLEADVRNQLEKKTLLEAIYKGANLDELDGFCNFFMSDILKDKELTHINIQFLRAHECLWDLEMNASKIRYEMKNGTFTDEKRIQFVKKRDEILDKLIPYLVECSHRGGYVKKWLADRTNDPISGRYPPPRITLKDVDTIMAKLHLQLKIEEKAPANGMKFN